MSESAADADFDHLLSFIEREFGFSTSYYTNSYLGRRIDARIRRNGLEAPAYVEYLEVLENDDGTERDALLDMLSVNVTSFFRNTDVWDEVATVLRTLQERRTVSAWSIPCSDGREPYSLAMLARDLPEVTTHQLSIRGSDIDENALERADNGVYAQQSTSDIANELSYLEDPSAYVDEADESFRVRPPIRRMVEFDRFDVINDTVESTYDLIMCRNFFIYVDAEHQRIVLQKLADALDSGGYLVLGKTESMSGAVADEFEPVNRKLRVYRRV